MTTIFKVLLPFLFLFQIGYTQRSDLTMFEPLMGKVWKAEGKWGDGSAFKQEIEFSYDLNKTLVIAKSKGFINKEQTEYGPRNHGIRKYNSEDKTIKFWEFDVFGGVTTGEIKIEGKNILYVYQYGESLVTDMWEYVDKNTYNFRVGSYQDGTWKQVYLETQFKAAEIKNNK